MTSCRCACASETPSPPLSPSLLITSRLDEGRDREDFRFVARSDRRVTVVSISGGEHLARSGHRRAAKRRETRCANRRPASTLVGQRRPQATLRTRWKASSPLESSRTGRSSRARRGRAGARIYRPADQAAQHPARSPRDVGGVPPNARNRAATVDSGADRSYAGPHRCTSRHCPRVANSNLAGSTPCTERQFRGAAKHGNESVVGL